MRSLAPAFQRSSRTAQISFQSRWWTLLRSFLVSVETLSLFPIFTVIRRESMPANKRWLFWLWSGARDLWMMDSCWWSDPAVWTVNLNALRTVADVSIFERKTLNPRLSSLSTATSSLVNWGNQIIELSEKVVSSLLPVPRSWLQISCIKSSIRCDDSVVAIKKCYLKTDQTRPVYGTQELKHIPIFQCFHRQWWWWTKGIIGILLPRCAYNMISLFRLRDTNLKLENAKDRLKNNRSA